MRDVYQEVPPERLRRRDTHVKRLRSVKRRRRDPGSAFAFHYFLW